MGSRGFKAAVMTIAAALIAAGAMTLVPSAYAAAVLRVGANYRLVSNTSGRADDVPGLAVDPTNQNHIVEANIDPIDLQCEYHVSFDGGQTWTGGDLTLPTPTSTVAFPSPACFQNFDSGGYAHFNTGIVFGSGQNVYVTFSIHQGAYNNPQNGPGQDGGNGDDAVVAISHDGGLTFPNVTVAVPGGGPVSVNRGLAGYGMRPQIAVQRGAGTGGQDRLYVASWNCFIRVRASATSRGGCSGGGGDRRIIVVRSDDGGQTWTSPVIASATGVRTGTLQPVLPTDPPVSGAAGEAESFDEQAVEPSQPVVGPDGAVYVAYKNRDITNDTNGMTCPPNPYIPATTAGGWPSNDAYCVVVARSTDGGAHWQQVAASPPVPNTTLVNPRLAIDTSVGTQGELYAVYQAANPGTKITNVEEVHSTDGGQTWSTPVQVNQGNRPGTDANNPYVAVGPGGVVDVDWWDQRNDYPGAGTTTRMADVYFAQSSDHGASFAANRRVTDRTLNESVGLYYDLGDSFNPTFDWWGPSLVPLADGSVLAAWPDSRLGSFDTGFQDIYLARLTPSAPPAQSTIATATEEGLSVDLSRLAYPGGNEAVGVESGQTPVSKIVVAGDSDEAGALLGAELARYNWAPEMVSAQSGLTPVQQAEAARILPEGAYLIGNQSTLSDTVAAQLTAATRDGENVVRIAPANSVATADDNADEARQVAELMAPLPVKTAVIVNPSTPEAAAGAAFAASLDYPLLFVDSRTTVPGPTSAAIGALGITQAFIIGGTGAVNSGVETALDTLLGATNVTRLGGADQYATSQAVAQEGVTLGLPDNVVYTADGARPIDAAVLASAVSRLGGMELLTPGANTSTALTDLQSMSLDTSVDRIVGAVGTGGADPTLPGPPQYTMIVSLSGNGTGKVSGSGISCPGTCTTTQNSGATVSLTAAAAPGSVFGGWSGACGGTGTCTGTLNQTLHVTATFFKAPKTASAPHCTLNASSKVKKGKIAVTVKCNQSARVSLSGTLKEKLTKKKSKTFKLGPARASVSANKGKSLTLTVPKAALAGHKPESVKLSLTAANSNGTSHASATIGKLKR